MTKTGFVFALILTSNLAAFADTLPDGNGQLETAPTSFNGGVDSGGRSYFLNGQPAQNGKLILTASNGFFDNGVCRASGESSRPKVGDESLIKPNFALIDDWKKTDGTLRWHIWLRKPGTVQLSFNMRVEKKAAGSRIAVSLAGESRSVTTVASAESNPQPWNLTFDVAKSGEHTISLSAQEIANVSGVGELHSIDVFGPAIDGAQLLRARWRPAAVHAGYACSTIDNSQTWVMTTRSNCDFSSYSPITTPFGYFGTSFESDRRVKGGFNFSMWAAGRGAKTPPLHQMPHLLAAGSREAVFSGFGHEGSGVKLRGWTPMPDRPRVCVQALRVESAGNYDTYYGYFWDHPSSKWKLYAVGRKWNMGKAKLHLSPGSFCEIPGPPHVQRSGDLVREVCRRGWHLGQDGKWHAMDTFKCKSKGLANKYWYTSQDGEFVMGTGGMRYYEFDRPATVVKRSPLPKFLSPTATQQLSQLPATIDKLKTTDVTKSTAQIDLNMSRAGANATAEVFFGEVDCLTFAKRELHGTERNSEISKSTQDDDRSWARKIELASLKAGSNLATISDLSPDTKYFARALVTNDDGKVWTFETHEFRTAK